MIAIDINDKMKEIARKGEKTILSGFKTDNNYTKLSEPDRFYNGIIGEMALAKLLFENGKRAQYTPDWNAGADDGDLMVWIDGRPQKVDVKMAGDPKYRYIMQPEAQFHKYAYEWYVGVRKNGDQAEIFGACHKNRLQPLNIKTLKVPTYGCLLDDLSPIDLFLNLIDDGKTIIIVNT